MEKDSKEWSWEFVVASGVVVEGECEISHLHLVPKAASTGTIVYDGTDANGRVLTHMVAAVITNAHMPFRPPAYMSQGIYVTLSANATGLLIQYRRLRGKDD